jgi:hypothetical protein
MFGLVFVRNAAAALHCVVFCAMTADLLAIVLVDPTFAVRVRHSVYHRFSCHLASFL